MLGQHHSRCLETKWKSKSKQTRSVYNWIIFFLDHLGYFINLWSKRLLLSNPTKHLQETSLRTWNSLPSTLAAPWDGLDPTTVCYPAPPDGSSPGPASRTPSHAVGRQHYLFSFYFTLCFSNLKTNIRGKLEIREERKERKSQLHIS